MSNRDNQVVRNFATWKLTLEYDGTRYSGWQEQRNARTVMGELRRAAETIFAGEVELQGSGRTDAGVHALAQVAHLRTHTKPGRSAPDLIRALNDELPTDIVVYEAEQVANQFHARHDASGRVYRYQISTRKSAFSKKYVWWVKEPLDVGVMERAAKLLAGRHNFICFRAEDASKPGESTVVVVDEARIEVHEHLIVFRIEASHYLWRMVRRLVGVLVKLGKREIELADFERLLAGECDSRLDVAAWTAPASGLFLEEVHYAAKSNSAGVDASRSANRRAFVAASNKSPAAGVKSVEPQKRRKRTPQA
ncbi:MAG: tRNA pseudouridine(38-40) synthase TruA [Acidobacteriaceae bacterium]|nr:tRNA pseudouridine(38-40) synthase TruA [Acidobacteriaceae bacterium]